KQLRQPPPAVVCLDARTARRCRHSRQCGGSAGVQPLRRAAGHANYRRTGRIHHPLGRREVPVLICVLGMAGTGKTALTRALAAKLKATRLHPGQYAWEKGFVATRFPSRAQLLAAPGLADSFLEAAGRQSSAGLVLLDGFPRSEEQARMLAATRWKPV